MSWLIIIVSAYLILAAVSLFDKYILTEVVQEPKVYAFYVGLLGFLIVLIAPFVGFYIPDFSKITLGLSAGATGIFALFWMYKAIRSFEISRVGPVIGALVPFFTFGLVRVFSLDSRALSVSEIVAFVLLVAGSFLIVADRKKTINFASLKYSSLAAFLLSISFILSKETYSILGFGTGLVWRGVGGLLAALFFFSLFSAVRKEVLSSKRKIPRKNIFIFFSNQAAGGGAVVLQNWAIALAPIAYLPFINALSGIQYAFLLAIVLFVSKKFSWVLKEEFDRGTLFQKSAAVALIILGLIFFNI